MVFTQEVCYNKSVMIGRCTPMSNKQQRHSISDEV